MEPSEEHPLHSTFEQDNEVMSDSLEDGDVQHQEEAMLDTSNDMNPLGTVSETSDIIDVGADTTSSNMETGSSTISLGSAASASRPSSRHYHHRTSSGRLSTNSPSLTHQSLLRKQASTSSTFAASLSSASPSFHEEQHEATLPPHRLSLKRGLSSTPLHHHHHTDPSDDISTTSDILRPSLGWSIVETNPDTSGTAPCQRSLHTAAVLNGALYVFGGYDGQSRVNDFHAFFFGERRWSPVLPSATSGPPPSPRDRHIAVVHSHSFYVFGGFDGQSRVNDFFGFHFSNMGWRRVTAAAGAAPSPRHSHAGVVHNNSLFVFGGYDGSYRSDFHEFHFLERVWSAVPGVGRPPRARYRATTVVHDNSMLLFGGHDGTRHLADTHVFDFRNRVWSTLVTEGPPPIPRDSHVAVVHESSMYVFGGSTGEAMNDLHELKLSGGLAKWSPVVRSSSYVTPGHRFCHVAAVYGDAMYVFGGYDGSNRLNDFIKFDFEIDDLTCPVPPSTLIHDLRSFIDNETMSDITLLIDNRPIYAHKIMLMRSSYFRAMLTGDMRESQQTTISLSQVRYSIFLSVLEYLYTDTVNIEIGEAMELFVAADQFCIPRLKAICEKKMLASITVDNAASIYYAADLHSAKSLKQKTLKFILTHFESVSKTKSFEEMARGNVELVFEILKSR